MLGMRRDKTKQRFVPTQGEGCAWAKIVKWEFSTTTLGIMTLSEEYEAQEESYARIQDVMFRAILLD